ncbi:bifunctional lysylphosphatidylglycerol synthetase/lysine--tRNA ligase LysX [Actinomyces faecalis]|uniref:bifunctional lysylphosphatidylglycerol synthetase/lysine--tRNA ligase LysX n=1 Tax=Actinomyces faecalis TaxID=2722820 RepID=UPI001557E10E|nr:bifunctional lysylphosphatidylglycerol synthetase/lysine--tRNA ligase LysX [Actinomyces faecalis]
MSPARHKPPLACRLLPTGLYIAAALAIIETVLGSVSWVDRPLDIIFTWLIPLPIIDWFSAIVTILLAAGLGRRKRLAWIVTTVIATVLLALYALLLVFALTVPDSVSLEPSSALSAHYTVPTWLLCALTVNVLILLIILAALLRHRRYYTVRSQPGDYKRALSVFILGSTAVAVIGINVVFILNGVGLHQVLRLFTGRHDPDWLFSAMGLGWALCALAALWLMMQAQHKATQISAEEERRIRSLLADSPTDSLGYFATRRDKSAIFTEHGGVVYRSAMGVALASGDPLGDPSVWPAAARSFVAHASDYGLAPAVIGASEAGARAYVRAGLKAMRIGDEAILRPASFRLAELPEVRRAARHVTSLGYTVRIRRHRQIPAEELAHLTFLADQWLGGASERGFSMALSRLGDPSDGQCVMVEALFPDGDERGEVAALLSFVPWGADGLSLDVMRRHPLADNGVTELMVSSLMAAGSELSIHQVSLNFVVFRSAFEQGAKIGASAVLSLWRKILLFASRWWQLESLYRSNQKYSPDWFPRLICYADAGDLPRASLAMGVAEGFVSLPAGLGGDTGAQPRRSDVDSERLLTVTAGAVGHRRPPRVPTEVRERLAARTRMLSDGVDPYPASVTVTASCAAALAACAEQPAVGTIPDDDAPASRPSPPMTVAGRVMSLRDHGGVIFASVRDWSADLQLLIDAAGTGQEPLNSFRRLVRIGDQVAITGRPGASRNGTPSLLVSSWTMTSKALRPLPDKHRGLQDPETRVRQRHLALITSPRDRQMLMARSHAIQAVRSTLLDRGYLEVETPMLHPVHGGANARPFRTHINAYDLDLYLRIAPELYLKRLMVAGADRVFEIGRSFRNEGADATHNPEFTMLEAYQSYADYTVMKEVVQDLTVRAAKAALGTTLIHGTVGGVEHEIDLAAPWRTVSVCDAVAEHLGEPVDVGTPLETLRAFADRLGLAYAPSWGWGTMVQHLYEHLAEGTTAQPTFFTDFPAETSPLTRPHRSLPRLAERWDLIIFGSEVGTAYSELVDPVLQRERLTAQSLAAAGGDAEAMELDEAFLQALEQGMPPTGGLGVGLDRLVMMLTGTSIRETITFPLVRPGQ